MNGDCVGGPEEFSHPSAVPFRRGDLSRGQRLEIGLVNNMPDAALNAAERQFASLLEASAGDLDIRLHLFHLPSVERSPFTLARMRGRYAEIGRLEEANLDALIVTGAEPRAETLRGEPFWPDLERLVDWTTASGTASLWSCLAAHAAVLALDGVDRQRLAAKRSGLFAWERIDSEPGLDGVPAAGVTPHSRYNDLDPDALAAHGYRILTWSAKAGVDVFAKRCGGLFVCAQGHPEYDGDTLLREYRRDISRWRPGLPQPALPQDYFPGDLERELKALEPDADGNRAMRSFEEATKGFSPLRPWDGGAIKLFGGFLRLVAAEQQARRAGARADLELQA